jgi:hypothetical protein
LSIDVTALGDGGTLIYESFRDYALSLQEIMTGSLPDLLEKANELPNEAEEVKNAAESEFDGLDMMKKGKALLATGINLKLISKIPIFVKAAVENLK